MISEKMLRKKDLLDRFKNPVGLVPYLVGMETPEMAS